jgi:4-alpha-glucanotransferase
MTLDEIAQQAGIEPSFRDYFGKESFVSDDTKRALLDAMGFDSGAALTPPLVLVEGGTEQLSPYSAVVLESGIRFSGDARELPLGYHRIVNERDGTSRTLIVVPQHCYLPSESDGRIWALATQLYAIRSRRNWGIGDFSDLAGIARLAGRAGARAVALNPLHELYPSNPAACSPYAPSSRLFLASLYIDVTSVPDFDGSQDDNAIESLRDSELVDYPGVARVKLPALERCFAAFRHNHLTRPGDARATRFRSFVRDGGIALERLAVYEALAERFHREDVRRFGWLQWPQPYRMPDSPAVARFAREHRERVDFYLYLQWIADQQLAAAARTAAAHGIGLYRDLAVGVAHNSADVWSGRESMLEGVSLGAPPDAYNAHGQNWGLAPLSPHALRRLDYAPFAELLRANMRHASILRIDHVMALRRAFWIPAGHRAIEGAYVNYPFDEMLGIVALESVRNRCTVVGEDLGTLPHGFRERMHEASTLSSRLVYFERDWPHGRFVEPWRYPRLAAASIGTHDLPPLAGWWTGNDVAARERIGLYLDDTAAAQAHEERAAARFALVTALAEAGAAGEAVAGRLRADAEAGGTAAAVDELTRAVYRFLASTPSIVAVVAIEDALGEVDSVNVPGTLEEHPNWRRKHTRSLEEIGRDGSLMQIGEIFA